MNFRSDNEAGAHPAIIEAVSKAFRAGPVHSYGADAWTQKVEHRLREIFEKPDLAAYPVADRHRRQRAGARLLLAAVGLDLLPSHRAHRGRGSQRRRSSTSGRASSAIDGPAGKIDPKALAEALAQPVYGVVHHPQPSAVSLTQATECGAAYAPEEIAAISTSARRHGLKMHMDGARFANALSFVGCSPAELTVEGRRRRAEPRRHQERRDGRRGRDLLRPGARQGVRVPPQARRPPLLQDAAACPRSSTPISATACGWTMPATPTRWRAGWWPG